MIRINLLADEASKGSSKKSAAPKAPAQGQADMIAVAIFFLCALVAGAVFWTGKQKLDEANALVLERQNQKKDLETEISRLSPEAREMRDANMRLESQHTVLMALDPPDRVLWSEKLAYLSELIPEDVFVTRIEITENQQQVEIEETREALEEWESSGREGEAPVVQTKPVVTYNLTIHGLASGENNVQQFDNVLNFHNALQNHRAQNTAGEEVGFMTQFNPTIEVDYVEATLYKNEYPVNEFVFVLRTLPPEEPEEELDPEDAMADVAVGS